MISVPETEPHCSLFIDGEIDTDALVISVPETEPHCSSTGAAKAVGEKLVISVPETEPHCSVDCGHVETRIQIP